MTGISGKSCGFGFVCYENADEALSVSFCDLKIVKFTYPYPNKNN